jgi:hypothetical protein
MGKVLLLAVWLAMQIAPPMPGQQAGAASNSANDPTQQRKSDKKATKPPLSLPALQPGDPSPQRQGVAAKNEEQSVKLTGIPPISIVEKQKTPLDYIFDWGPWGFNLLLVIVGAVGVWLARRTLRAIDRQANLMKRQADLMDAQVSVMQVPYKQWIEFDNWITGYGDPAGGLRISVDIMNPTDFPMTIKEGCVQFKFRNGGVSKYHIAIGSLLSPKKRHTLDIRIPVCDEDVHEMRNGMLPIPTHGLFLYWGPLGEGVVTKQTLVGQINCGKYGTNFIAVTQTTEQQTKDQEEENRKAN